MPSRELTASEEREAEENARKLKATEALILALLLRTIADVVSKSRKAGLSHMAIAPALANALHSAIMRARRLARTAGRARLAAEAKALGASLQTEISARTLVQDSARAQLLAQRHARRWLDAVKKAEAKNEAARIIARKDVGEDDDEAEDATAPAVVIATQETVAAIERIAATENAQAFTNERTIAHTELMFGLKRWDARLDKATCPFCRHADGTLVELHERFPQGEPGDVHPNCRCSWSLVHP